MPSVVGSRDRVKQPVAIPISPAKVIRCEASLHPPEFVLRAIRVVVGLPSQNYAVLYKATLNAPTWTSIATNRSIGTLTTFTDTNAARFAQPQGYYRVTLIP